MFRIKPKRLLHLVAILGVMSAPVLATVFYSKDEAMKLAFGDDATVDTMSLFPSAEEVAKIEQLAKLKLDSNLISVYVGKKNDAIVGYAMIDSHTVRTQAETLLLVLTADGKLRNVYTLAFHEPPEYQPPERWMALLSNRGIDQLTLDKDIQGVAGATLSARAAVDSARKILAIYQVLLQSKSN
ncbi:FMN-binding protein [Methylomonas koyamae]|uniref:FMN-binding protein n=1 Tax=Methylomonas koyamae TaxID=702114 RepID=UPI00112C738F|nr:FMN-binding protein [Methylomonas koyamae]TPQ26865.1 FMN-binding protein [Methylomonas koyamae]